VPIHEIDCTTYEGGSRLTWTLFPPKTQQKSKTILWAVGGSTALTAWQVAMHPTSVHYSQYKIASDLVTPSIEQYCIIKFLVKENVKSAEILHRLNPQYGEETLSFVSVHD
jgi:hypothetical protein